MIPPSQSIRLRSITRWMQDNDPQAASLPPAELSSRASSMDDQMIETFETLDQEIMDRLMREGTWGTEAGLQQYSLERMEAWQDTVSQHLPTTMPLDSED